MVEIGNGGAVRQLWNFAREEVVAKENHEQLGELGDAVKTLAQRQQRLQPLLAPAAPLGRPLRARPMQVEQSGSYAHGKTPTKSRNRSQRRMNGS